MLPAIFVAVFADDLVTQTKAGRNHAYASQHHRRVYGDPSRLADPSTGVPMESAQDYHVFAVFPTAFPRPFETITEALIRT